VTTNRTFVRQDNVNWVLLDQIERCVKAEGWLNRDVELKIVPYFIWKTEEENGS
jgi:hypothetical protein